MRTKLLASSILFVVMILVAGCLNTSDSPEVITNNGTNPKCVGLWKTRLPFKSFTGYNVLLDLNIKPAPDTTYTLVGISDSTLDTILAHSGFWYLNSAQDTIYLNGINCRIIDTTQKKLVLRDCVPIKASVNINNNEWTMQLAELLPLAEQLSIKIPPQFLPTLQQIPVVLTKQ